MNEKDLFNYYSFFIVRYIYMYLKNILIYNKKKKEEVDLFIK